MHYQYSIRAVFGCWESIRHSKFSGTWFRLIEMRNFPWNQRLIRKIQILFYDICFSSVGNQRGNWGFRLVRVTWPRSRASCWSSCSDMPSSTWESTCATRVDVRVVDMVREENVKERERIARVRGAEHKCWSSAIDDLPRTLKTSPPTGLKPQPPVNWRQYPPEDFFVPDVL